MENYQRTDMSYIEFEDIPDTGLNVYFDVYGQYYLLELISDEKDGYRYYIFVDQDIKIGTIIRMNTYDYNNCSVSSYYKNMNCYFEGVALKIDDGLHKKIISDIEKSAFG